MGILIKSPRVVEIVFRHIKTVWDFYLLLQEKVGKTKQKSNSKRCDSVASMQSIPHLNNLTLTLSHPSAGLSCYEQKIIFCSLSEKCGVDLADWRDWVSKTLTYLSHSQLTES